MRADPDRGATPAAEGAESSPTRRVSPRALSVDWPQASSGFWNTSPACSRSAWNLIFGQFSCVAGSGATRVAGLLQGRRLWQR
jgi:hypothetical protein